MVGAFGSSKEFFKKLDEILPDLVVKSEREQLNRFSLYFSAKADTLPTIKGLDFDEKDAFVIESNARHDTIRYWIKDTTLCERDTLTFQMDYLATDTLGKLVPKTDTLRM